MSLEGGEKILSFTVSATDLKLNSFPFSNILHSVLGHLGLVGRVVHNW